ELAEDGLKFAELKEDNADDAEIVEAVREATVETLGYFLKPSELFKAIAKNGNNGVSDDEDTNEDTNEESKKNNFILNDLSKILKNIEQSTLGTESADDFSNLFEDLDLTSSKLGATEKAKNDLVAKILVHLNKIDFRLADTSADVLGDAYEYLIGEFASGA
ncbi:MAG: type I restriction-modification system subunit M, partial [Dolichospermum sp.]